MGSGVLEWTADPFKAYAGSPSTSPLFGKRFRVARGGVGLREEEKAQARVTYRQPVEPLNRRLTLGFRCVKDAR